MFERLKSGIRSFLGVSATQRVMKPSSSIPPSPSAYVRSQVLTAYSQLSSLQKRQLMWWLYKVNIAAKSTTRLTLNPVIGNTGIGLSFSDKTPTIKQVVSRYMTFNRLHRPKHQRRFVRGYMNTGELCFLTAPFQDTWYSVYCPALLIRHVLLDPLNPEELLAVVLESSYLETDKTYLYKIITDESRLSEPAQQIRKTIPYSCFYWANFEHDEVEQTTYPIAEKQISPNLSALAKQYGFDALQWLQCERRGEPFFGAWSDLFDTMVDIIWALFDKTKSWGAFHTWFQVKTNEPEFEKSVAKVKLWQQSIGTPDMNSMIYTDESIDLKPMSYPMQSNDIKKVIDTLFQLTGLAGNVATYDLGANLNTTYATTRSQGSPQEQFEMWIQGDMEDTYLDQARFVTWDAVQKNQIPREELEALRDATT